MALLAVGGGGAIKAPPRPEERLSVPTSARPSQPKSES